MERDLMNVLADFALSSSPVLRIKFVLQGIRTNFIVVWIQIQINDRVARWLQHHFPLKWFFSGGVERGV